MSNQLIKVAISEYYTEQQWLLLMLKAQWVTEQYSHLTRDILQLNEYMTVEITSYNSFTPTTIHQVYIQLVSPRSIRPIPVSCAIDIEQDYYTHIRKEIHNLIKTARYELFQLYRGREFNLQALVR